MKVKGAEPAERQIYLKRRLSRRMGLTQLLRFCQNEGKREWGNTCKATDPTFISFQSFPSILSRGRAQNMLTVTAFVRLPPRQLIRVFSSSTRKLEYFPNVDQKVSGRKTSCVCSFVANTCPSPIRDSKRRCKSRTRSSLLTSTLSKLSLLVEYPPKMFTVSTAQLVWTLQGSRADLGEGHQGRRVDIWEREAV